ncbi:11370_t:CDS:2, partial [Cetraspora pellucida]
MEILEDLECFLETLDSVSMPVPEHDSEDINYDDNEKIEEDSQVELELNSSSKEKRSMLPSLHRNTIRSPINKLPVKTVNKVKSFIKLTSEQH